MRCLWITRDYPCPPTAGDLLYSYYVATTLAAAGAEVTVVCRARDDQPPVPPEPGVEWRIVDAPLRSARSSLVSGLPSVAYRNGVHAMRRAVELELERDWDVILVDNVGAGWVLPLLESHRARASKRPLLVYVSHNHEASTRGAVARNASGSAAKRAVLMWDARKVDPLERALVAAADLVTVNTADDELVYRRDSPDQRYLVVTPGYLEQVVERRTFDEQIPRRAVIVGSFDWLAKRMNLEEFVEAADPLFAEAGAELIVIGRGPAPWLESMRAKTSATRFTGFVDSVTPYLSEARFGIVSERSGGGFKHKVLFYVFNRVPLAVLEGSVAGMPLVAGESMIEAPTVEELARQVLSGMDDTALLDRLQTCAFAACDGGYDWTTRGAELFRALESLRAE